MRAVKSNPLDSNESLNTRTMIYLTYMERPHPSQGKRFRPAGGCISAKFYNINLNCASTEEKDDVVKDAFYAKLENVYDKCPAHDAKIVFGDFNAKYGREGIFGPTVGQFNLYEHYIHGYDAPRRSRHP